MSREVRHPEKCCQSLLNDEVTEDAVYYRGDPCAGNIRKF